MGGKGSGGARLRSGPPPDPHALRRDRDAKDWTTLWGPRDKPAPSWPVEVPDPSVPELAMWTRLWTEQPQARVWEADHVFDLVALYVRVYLESVQPEAPAARATQAKQLAEALLLTTPALHAARYIIKDTAGPKPDPEAEARSRHPAGKAQPRPGSARAMLTVVEPDGDEG